MKRIILIDATIKVFCKTEEVESITAALRIQYGESLRTVGTTTDGKCKEMTFSINEVRQWGCVCGSDGDKPCMCGSSRYLSAREKAISTHMFQQKKVRLSRDKEWLDEIMQDHINAHKKARENVFTQWFKKHFCR